MRASDLTEEHIGRSFLVPVTDGRERRRIVFEGVTKRPDAGILSGGGSAGGDPHWLILLCSPTPGVMWFRTPAGKAFPGVIVRATAVIFPVEVDYAVTADGEIIETAVRTA